MQGVFSDSERKSMQAMMARVTEPVSYQAFQHFITTAQWDAERQAILTRNGATTLARVAKGVDRERAAVWRR